MKKMSANVTGSKIDVHHFNVDAGDCTLIVVSEEKDDTCLSAVLIDCGPVDAWTLRAQIPFGKIAKSYTNFKLTAIVVTHFDKDHMFGLIELLCEASAVLDQGKNVAPLSYLQGTKIYDTNTNVAPLFQTYINKLGKTYVVRQTEPTDGLASNHVGKEIFWGSYTASADGIPDLISQATKKEKPGLFCLACNQYFLKRKSSLSITQDDRSGDNNTSLILMLVSPTGEMLEYFGGDSGASREEAILPFIYNTSADMNPTSVGQDPAVPTLQVLKYSHHGANTSASPKLLDYFAPTYSVISAGSSNTHPAWEIPMYINYWVNTTAAQRNNKNSKLYVSTSNQTGGFHNFIAVSFPYYLPTGEDPDVPKALAPYTRELGTDEILPGFSRAALLNNLFKKLSTQQNSPNAGQASVYYNLLGGDSGVTQDNETQISLSNIVYEFYKNYVLQVGAESCKPNAISLQNYNTGNSYYTNQSISFELSKGWVAELQPVAIHDPAGGPTPAKRRFVEPEQLGINVYDRGPSSSDYASSVGRESRSMDKRPKPGSGAAMKVENIIADEQFPTINAKCVLYAGTVSPLPSNRWIYLDQDSILYSLVSGLPDGVLAIDADAPGVAGPVSVTGSIVDLIGYYFGRINVSNIVISIKNANLTVNGTGSTLQTSTAEIKFTCAFLGQSFTGTVVKSRSFQQTQGSQFSNVWDDDFIVGFLPDGTSSTASMLDIYQGFSNTSSDPIGLENIGSSYVLNSKTCIILDGTGGGTVDIFFGLDPRTDLPICNHLIVIKAKDVNNPDSTSIYFNRSLFPRPDCSHYSTGFSIGASVEVQIGGVTLYGSLIFDGKSILSLTVDITGQSPNDIIQKLGGNYTLPDNITFKSDLSGSQALTLQTKLDIILGAKMEITIAGIITTPNIKLSADASLTLVGGVTWSATTGIILIGSISTSINLSGLFNTQVKTTPLNSNVNSTLKNDTLAASVAMTYNIDLNTYSITADFAETIQILSQITIESIGVTYTKTPYDYSIVLHGTVYLSNDEILYLETDYDKQTGQWSLRGHIEDLSLSNLVTFFPTSTADVLEPILSKITIATADFSFNMSTGTHNLEAQILLGDSAVEFNVTYQFDGQNDLFHCELSTPGVDQISLAGVLSDLGITNAELIAFSQGVKFTFGLIDLDYDSASQRLSMACMTKDKTISMVYVKDCSTSISLSRVIFGMVPNFPIGNVPAPFSIFVYYASQSGLTIQNLNDLKQSDDPDPNGYSFLIQQAATKGSLTATSAIVFLPTTNIEDAFSVDLSSLELKSSVTSIQWKNVGKNFGPLFVDKVGISYGPPISVVFDADLTIGPLQLTLNQLTLEISYSKSSLNIDFTLGGLGIEYSQGDLTIAGDFLVVVPSSSYKKQFSGGVIITLADLTITAAGSYAEVYNNPNDSSQGTYSSFFIFGLLDAALGGPPIAYVTGLSAGFGAGQDLIIPSIDNVTNFPLLGIPPGGVFGGQSDVLQILGSLTTSENSGPWVTLDPNGGKWVAFGINFTSFELVQTNALLTVNFGGNDDLEIALLARSVFSLPQNVSSDQAFVYAELDVDATLQPSIGLFKFDAILTKNSFVLDRDCVLTGGFAARNWFGDNPYSGDFVITLGGYHPKYTPPSWYPSVDRLGFNWQYSDHISISGDAYFAITPTCGMGGGGLQFLFQDDHVRASYTAHTDVFVRWHPFYFNADIGVSIEASIHLDCFFFSINKTVELGADINIWGPPIGGTVSAHFGPFGFTVSFGADDPGLSQTIPWAEFANLLPHTTDDLGNSEIKMIKFTVEKGLVQPNGVSNTTGNSIWTVRPGQFQFRIETSVPMTQITFPGSVDSAYPKDNDAVKPVLNILPTGDMGATSTHIVEITGSANTLISNWIVVDQPSSNPSLPTGIIQRNLPAAMWGASDSDKSQPPIPLWTGMVLKAGIQPPTNVSAVISLAVFDADDPTPIGKGLNMNLPPQSGVALVNPTFNRSVSAHEAILDAIESSDKTAARNDLLTSLSNMDGMGSFGRISDLNTLALDLEAVFPDPPVIMDLDLVDGSIINNGPGPPQYTLYFEVSRSGPVDWTVQFAGSSTVDYSGTIGYNDVYGQADIDPHDPSEFTLVIKDDMSGQAFSIIQNLNDAVYRS